MSYEDKIWSDLITEFDKNGDGEIDFEEFEDMIRVNINDSM